MRFRTVLEGIGAGLLLYPYYQPLLSVSNLFIYHHGLPVTRIVDGVLVDILCAALLTMGFLVVIQYLPMVVRKTLYTLYASLMVCVILYGAFMMFDSLYAFSWKHDWMYACIVTLLTCAILAYFLPRFTESAVHAVRTLIAAFAFSAIWIIPHLLHLTQARQHAVNAASNHLPAPSAIGFNRRIVWILLDELSYDQTFDHPVAGLALPNFNHIRSESVSFSHLKPAGFFTDHIIPSLFSGHPINEIRSTVDGDLWYKGETQKRWVAYDPNDTLFGLAQRNGWSSGVDGWYNPYCHILDSVLNVCSWEPFFGMTTFEANGASEENSVLGNAAAMPNVILAKLTKRSANPSVPHLKAYRNVLTNAQALIQNDQINFVFLHFPVPHPPGIYDRQTHLLRSSGTYLDNLVLADDTLGVLLQEINNTPSASRTTVIISSDHSWRISLYRDHEDWTSEEERASGGHFDDRPVLLVHFPGQNSGSEVSSALPEMLEHDIIAGMLQGKINNPEDLSTLIAQPGY